MKKYILARWLRSNGIKLHMDEIAEISDDDDIFGFYGEEYLVLSDEGANEKAREYILDSLWAFNSSFLESHTGIDEEVLRQIQEKMCEGCNEVILRLIKDIEHLISDAILSDGRGHFLSSYDGKENEIKYCKKYYYIYRVN